MQPLRLVRYLLIGACALCAMWLTRWWWVHQSGEAPAETVSAPHVSEPATSASEPPADDSQPQPQEAKGLEAIGGPFSLVDVSTHQLVTDRSFPGKFLLVYFGFSHCPDVCQTSLHTISVMLEELATKHPDALDRLQPIFITLDPKHDTEARLLEYKSLFHPKIMMLRGEESAIQQAAEAYRVYHRVVQPSEHPAAGGPLTPKQAASPSQDPTHDHTEGHDAPAAATEEEDHPVQLDHSALLYVMAPDGRCVAFFPHHVAPEALAASLVMHMDKVASAPDAEDTRTPPSEAPTKEGPRG